MAEQYKALTFIHFPFIEERFVPGDTISHSVFEKYADAAVAATPVHDDERGGHVPTAEEQVEQMIEFGSLSEDLDAPVHPDHRPVVPGKPTLAQLIEQAKETVADLEERGQDIPGELRDLAELDYNHVVAAADNGSGGDEHVS